MTGKRGIEALVFDFDGVIADTEPLHWRSWATVLKPMGISFTWEQYCELGLGVNDGEMIRSFVPLLKDAASRRT